MKKYLTTGVAAIAFVVAFTSCSKSTDLYDQAAVDEKNRQEQEKKDQQKEMTVNEKYAFAFEKAFGKVGSNVDWGFSSKNTNTRVFTRAVGDYASYKGNMQPTLDPSFPTDCAASNFLKEDEIPTTAQAMPNSQGGAGPYYIDENTTQVDSWSSQCVIYVKGNVDMSNKTFSLNSGAKVYLTEGSSLKLGSYAADGLNIAFYIANNATLETTGLLKVQTYPVYNHGTIKAKSYEINSTSILYNVGKLDVEESLIVQSTSNRIVNDGTIECASVTVNAGAVQNNAEWTVTGTTYINSNNSGWVNNGHWTTYNYAYVGGSENVINNCYLEVTNNFDINISSSVGSFKIDAGGGVLTKNFYGGRDTSSDPIATSGPYRIVMGQNAVFKVTETATLEGGNPGQGFFGPSEGEYAVFQAKNIVRNPEHEGTHGAVTYGGNLYVSAETHFAQGYDSDGSGSVEPKPFIYEQDGFTTANNIYAAGFKSGKPDINIPQTPCSPGFKGGNPLYRVIAEDLSASESGDFDFNDVVFDVVKAEGGKTTLKLICAGGVLPLRVRGANENGGVEIHSVFGETAPNAKGEYQMYNTGAGPTVPEATFTVEGEYTTPEQIKNIIIEVQKNNVWMELKATKGEAACKILVDDTFKPVTERRNIADENKKFTNYVQGTFQDDFWWK